MNEMITYTKEELKRRNEMITYAKEGEKRRIIKW